MGNKPPAGVATAIKDIVYREADRFCYLARDRVANGQFLDRLVEHPQVGGVLEQHIQKAEVRTYIKDAILNRYSKDKTLEAAPLNQDEIVSKTLNEEFRLIETHASSGVSLLRSASGVRYVVAARGTYLKWETALRKALLYIPKKPFASGGNSIEIVLFLYAQSRPISNAEKELLNAALSQAKASAYLYGER